MHVIYLSISMWVMMNKKLFLMNLVFFEEETLQYH